MQINSRVKIKISRDASILEEYRLLDIYFSEDLLSVQNKDGLYGYINKKMKK